MAAVCQCLRKCMQNSTCTRPQGGPWHEWKRGRSKTFAQQSGSKEVLHNSFLLTSSVSCSFQLSDLASYLPILILAHFHLVLGIFFLDSQYLFWASFFGSTLATHIVDDVYLFLIHC